jgi:hypothetical protein
VLALVMLPAAWFAGRSDTSRQAPTRAQPELSGRQALMGALRHPPFVVMALAYTVCGMQLVFLTTHLPAYLDICGMDPMLSAKALGMIGGFNVLGSLFFGWAGGRVNKLLLLGGIYICRSLGFIWFFHPADPGKHAGVLRGHGVSLAGRVAAGARMDCADVRPALAGDDRRRGVLQSPDRQLYRRLRGRLAL